MPNEQPDQLSIVDWGPRRRLAVPAMTRVLALLVAFMPTVMLTLAEDQSRQNKSEGSASFGVEPPILKQNLSTDRSAPDAPGDAIARLKVMECEAELASARLAEAKGKVAALESGVASGESAKDQLAITKAALKQLSEAAEAATAKRERAELEAAEANLHRQQQLLKLGVAGKSDVDRAEEKLASSRRRSINDDRIGEVEHAHATFALKKRRQAAALQSDQRLVRRPGDHHATLTVPSRPHLRHA